MTGFLPWHDEMLIDDAERQYFLDNFPYWRIEAERGGVETRCNLVAPMTSVDWRRRLSGRRTDSIAALARVQLSKPPPTANLDRIGAELEEIELIIPTAVIDAVPEGKRDPHRQSCTTVEELEEAVTAARQELEYRGGYPANPVATCSQASVQFMRTDSATFGTAQPIRN
jgi:hypothetical protein